MFNNRKLKKNSEVRRAQKGEENDDDAQKFKREKMKEKHEANNAVLYSMYEKLEKVYVYRSNLARRKFQINNERKRTKYGYVCVCRCMECRGV